MGQLTVARVKTLTEAGRYIDGDGLMLVVKPTGAQSWTLRVRIGGDRRDIGLGSAKVLTLAEARAKAAELRRDIARGLDPIAEKKKVVDPVPTFRDAATRVHADHKAAWKNGKHQAQWINTLETYAFPMIGDRPVDKIEGPLIRDVLAPIWLTKPETARRVRQRIGTVLDWSYVKGYRKTEAPMRSLSKGLPRQPRKDGHFAAMPYADVPKLVAQLRERSSVGRLALEALILTAARSGEIRGATWSEVDLGAGMWSVPAERMKMGRVHHVPLAPQAIEAFRRAEGLRVPCSDLVFPGQKPKSPVSDMTLLKVMRDMETGVTVHGFRSAFRDWVSSAPEGVSRGPGIRGKPRYLKDFERRAAAGRAPRGAQKVDYQMAFRTGPVGPFSGLFERLIRSVASTKWGGRAPSRVPNVVAQAGWNGVDDAVLQVPHPALHSLCGRLAHHFQRQGACSHHGGIAGYIR